MGTIIENRVSLQGSDEDIRRFKEFMKSGLSCFDFNNVIKMPVELHEVQNEMGMKYLMLKSKMVFTREEYELVTSFEKLSEERKEELLDTGRAASSGTHARPTTRARWALRPKSMSSKAGCFPCSILSANIRSRIVT